MSKYGFERRHVSPHAPFTRKHTCGGSTSHHRSGRASSTRCDEARFHTVLHACGTVWCRRFLHAMHARRLPLHVYPATLRIYKCSVAHKASSLAALLHSDEWLHRCGHRSQYSYCGATTLDTVVGFLSNGHAAGSFAPSDLHPYQDSPFTHLLPHGLHAYGGSPVPLLVP